MAAPIPLVPVRLYACITHTRTFTNPGTCTERLRALVRLKRLGPDANISSDFVVDRATPTTLTYRSAAEPVKPAIAGDFCLAADDMMQAHRAMHGGAKVARTSRAWMLNVLISDALVGALTCAPGSRLYTAHTSTRDVLAFAHAVTLGDANVVVGTKAYFEAAHLREDEWEMHPVSHKVDAAGEHTLELEFFGERTFVFHGPALAALADHIDRNRLTLRATAWRPISAAEYTAMTGIAVPDPEHTRCHGALNDAHDIVACTTVTRALPGPAVPPLLEGTVLNIPTAYANCDDSALESFLAYAAEQQWFGECKRVLVYEPPTAALESVGFTAITESAGHGTISVLTL